MAGTNDKKLIPAGVFGNGMVLQRGKECRIFGKSEGLEVTVTVEKDGCKECHKAPVENGAFVCALGIHDAGTGYKVTLSDGTDIVIFDDVCFGDVYYLCGQSNMELPVSRTLDVTGEEVMQCDYPYVRQYLLTPDYRLDPAKEAEAPVSPWIRAQGNDLMDFSAVGFFAARRLYDKTGIPVGLIHAAQGGASIEAWMPLDLLDGFGDYRKQAEPFMADGSVQDFLKNQDISQAEWVDSLNADLGKGFEYSIPDDADDILVPFIRNTSGDDVFFGSVWLYREFEMSADDIKGDDAFLYLGEMVDSDITYVNGKEVGTTDYCYPPRKYGFPTDILKPGKNLIAVRLIVEHGCSAFLPDHEYSITAGGRKTDLTGQWKYKIGTRTKTEKDRFFMAQWIPSALFQSSVLPVRHLAIKGFWWYQGESNASDPSRYDEKFKAMVLKFREVFGDDELPIICTVMADFDDPANGKIGDIATGFSDNGLTISDGWKCIQELQLHAPESVPLCSVVSAKDLSEPFELHPQNKSILGARFAEMAMLWN